MDKLPIGIQAFEVMRTQGFVYVDKTESIHRLATEGIYILEFKCGQNAAVAIDQIRARGYADPYRHGGKQVVLVGINFGLEARNVSDWAAETA